MENTKRMVPLAALKAEREKGKKRLTKMQEQIKMQEQMEDAETIETMQHEESLAEPLPTTDYLKEFAQLMQNPYYADSGKYVDQLIEYASTHNVPLKDAYNALYAEQKLQRQAHMVDAVASGSVPARVPAKLSEEETLAAKLCGMSPEEYARYK